MFHNNRLRSHSQTENLRHKTKKYKLNKNADNSKQSKYSKKPKVQKNREFSKLKCISTVSDYLGPDRLTKHVGFLSKGKISDSISRIEKVMSKEVKARARQDLQEVLKLSCSGKKKYRKNVIVNYENLSPETQSISSLHKSPHCFNQNTVFSSNSWKDRLQKSVGATVVNSVLASVHEPQKASPIKELQLIARKVLLNTINPFVEETNVLLFRGKSHIKKMQNKLRAIRNQLLPCVTVTSEAASPSGICENLQDVPNSEEISRTQNSSEDFQLNPIFTGDCMDQSDFSQIFPSANEYMNDKDDLLHNDSVNMPNGMCDYGTISSSHAQSSIDGKSSLTLVPTSPETSEDSPGWKFQLSPPKIFMPSYNATPTIYFRHKMF